MRLAGRFLSLFAARPNPKKFFQNISKRRRLAGSKGPVWCHVGGKGQNHHIPQGKGVRRWKLSPATMANSAGLMLSAKPYCEIKRRTRQINLPSATVSLQVVIGLCKRKETAALKIKAAVSNGRVKLSALRRLFFFCRRPAAC